MGFYRYFNYFIKCVIRRIVNSDWFWKISFLVLMVFVTGFLCNNIVYGAELEIYYAGQLPATNVYGGLITPVNSNHIYTSITGSSENNINTAFCFFAEAGVEYNINFRITSNTVTSYVHISTSNDMPSYGVKITDTEVHAMTGSFSYGYVIEGNNNWVNVAYYSGYYSYNEVYVSYYSTGTTTDLITSIQNQTTQTNNAINNASNNISNTLTQETEKIEDTMTNTEYDDNVVNIDVSSAEDVDDTEVTGLFTTVFENLSNLISSSSWSTVEVIEIGLPYTDGKIQLRSDILSNIVGNSLLRTLINVAWYSLFGLYVFRFVTNIYHSIKSGNILNGINFDNEVISSTML